jgi:hypothetical protein
VPGHAASVSATSQVAEEDVGRCRTRFELEPFLQLSRLFVVTAGALAVMGNLLLGLRGALAQRLGAGGLLLGGSGLLGSCPAQGVGFWGQFLSPCGMGVCLLTVSDRF